jgi:hypothetical protein
VQIILKQEASSFDTHHKLTLATPKIFVTGRFMSACHPWNEKHSIKKTWTQYKSHFAVVHCQHKQMKGKSTATARYQSTNDDVGQSEDQMAEATIGALSNLATATAAD